MFYLRSLRPWTNKITPTTNGNFNFSTRNFHKYKQSCTDLRQMPKDEVKSLFGKLETIVSDADGKCINSMVYFQTIDQNFLFNLGVLWLNDAAICGSPEAFNALIALKKQTFICTNNSTRTRQSLMEKACSLGYHVTTDNIISSSRALAQYLKMNGFNKRVYIIGREGLAQELKEAGISACDIGAYNMEGTVMDMMNNMTFEENIGAVIVGFDEFFSFPKLTLACTYLMDPDCLLLATNADERYPAGKMILPATGCFVRAVEASAERPALVIGKPNTLMCANLIKDGTIKPESTLMIGDRCEYLIIPLYLNNY